MARLPLEIWHLIFDYLDPFEIFTGFLSLNRSIDEIVYSYNRLQLNFRSMSKGKFRFICQRLEGSQVQSLVLSNDERSPGQVEMFFSFFTLHRFVHLQSIELNELGDSNLLVLLFSHLEAHPFLRSIALRTASMTMNKRNSRQLMELFSTLPNLSTLKYFRSSSLIDLRRPLVRLRHLTLQSCQLSHLRVILPLVPHLISLDVNGTSHLNDRLEAPGEVCPLESLALRSGQWTTFADLQNFLRQCPSLRRLIFESTGDVALLDGNEWKRLIERDLRRLKRIELNFSPEENPLRGHDVLLPFHNSFWMDERRTQFVSFISTASETCAQLFTVPHFQPRETWYPPSPGFYYYSIDSYPVERHCTALRISHYPPINPNAFVFAQIEVLSLDASFDQIEQLHAILHLSSVHHLKLSKSVGGKCLLDLLRHGPNLRQLTLHRPTLADFLDLTTNESTSFPPIRLLRLDDSTPTLPFSRLSSLFPELEGIHLSIQRREEIAGVLTHFIRLKHVQFHWLHKDQSSAVVTRQWFDERGIPLDEFDIVNDYRCDLWVDSADA